MQKLSINSPSNENANAFIKWCLSVWPQLKPHFPCKCAEWLDLHVRDWDGKLRPPTKLASHGHDKNDHLHCTTQYSIVVCNLGGGRKFQSLTWAFITVHSKQKALVNMDGKKHVTQVKLSQTSTLTVMIIWCLTFTAPEDKHKYSPVIPHETIWSIQHLKWKMTAICLNPDLLSR